MCSDIDLNPRPEGHSYKMQLILSLLLSKSPRIQKMMELSSMA